MPIIKVDVQTVKTEWIIVKTIVVFVERNSTEYARHVTNEHLNTFSTV